MLRPILKSAYAKLTDPSGPARSESRRALALGKRGMIVVRQDVDTPEAEDTGPDPRFLDRLNRELGKGDARKDDAAAGTEEALEPGAEQRFAKRRKTKMKAIIFDISGGSGVDCTVRDISSTGVLIDLPVEMTSVSRAGERVPARFVLRMPTERTEVDCELAWRSANKVGARFISPSRATSVEPRRRPMQSKPKASSGQLLNRLFSH